jgi:hypothetical protein
MHHSPALRDAARTGDLDRVNLLLQGGRVDPAADDNYAIRMASTNGHLSVVDRLLQDERVDPADDDNLAIRMASLYGYLSVVERLLQDARVDPVFRDNGAIRDAVGTDYRNGHLSTLDRLLQHPLVDATCLHSLTDIDNSITKAAAANQLSLAAVQRLSATLTLPFPRDSRIRAWQPRIRAYRKEAVALADTLTGQWRLDGVGVSAEVMDDIVWAYCFGVRLPPYCALDLKGVGGGSGGKGGASCCCF